MSFVGRRVDVGDAPTPLNTDDAGNVAGSSILLRVADGETEPVELGGADVAVGAGCPFTLDDGWLPVGFDRGEALYAVAAAGQVVTVYVLEQGV